MKGGAIDITMNEALKKNLLLAPSNGKRSNNIVRYRQNIAIAHAVLCLDRRRCTLSTLIRSVRAACVCASSHKFSQVVIFRCCNERSPEVCAGRHPRSRVRDASWSRGVVRNRRRKKRAHDTYLALSFVLSYREKIRRKRARLKGRTEKEEEEEEASWRISI